MNRFSLLLVLLLSLNSKAQSTFKYQDFIQSSNAKEKATIALELGNYYHRFCVDSLNTLGVTLKELYALENDPFVRAVYQKLLGGFDMKKGFVQEGLKMLKSSRSFFLNQGDNTLISEAFNETGQCYLLLSDFKKAKENFNSSIKFGADAQDKTLEYMAMINLAQCHYLGGDTISAQVFTRSYLTKALKANKFEAAANAYSFLGQMALDQKNHSLAIQYFDKQRTYADKTRAPFTVSRAKNNLAISFFLKGDFKQTLRLFTEVLEERKQQGVISYLCDAYLNMGNFHFENKNHETANIYIDSSIFLSKNNGLISNHIEALETRLEFDVSPNLKSEIKELKEKQKFFLEEQRKQRDVKSAIKINHSSLSTWPWYIYMIFVLIPFVSLLFFRSNLSDKR